MWALSSRATRTRFGRGGCSRGLAVGLLVVPLVLLSGIGATWACETPVYRYAMYRWQPTPYEVYAFHDESNADAHAAVEAAIAEVTDGTDNRANVVFIPVNVTTDPELNGVTPDIKAAWNSQQDRTLPSYLISTPYGAQIYSGKLPAAEIKDLVESPARKQLAQQLEAGKIGVLLFLGGQDQQQNERARQILQGLVKEVGEGKISLYTAPADDAVAEDKSAPAKPGLELGLIEVDRNDQKETWLVRSLLAMESDLPEESRPMVFLSYGRGRALLPYIGEGITRENLIHEVQFISGACSCTVKEQNPGVDLLVRYDWDAAAAALADRFGTEEGNESQFGPSDFLPQLIIPSSTVPPVADVAATTDVVAVKDASAGDLNSENTLPTTDDIQLENDVAKPEAGANAAGAGDVSTRENPTTDPGATATSVPAATSADAANAHDTGGESHGDVALVPTASAPDRVTTFQTDTVPTYFGMLVVGGGLALGLVILFGITLLVMRPH